MIIFDVVSEKSPWGSSGDRMRLYLNDVGYRKAEHLQKEGMIRIRSHAKVFAGHLHYDQKNNGPDEFQMKQEGG